MWTLLGALAILMRRGEKGANWNVHMSVFFPFLFDQGSCGICASWVLLVRTSTEVHSLHSAERKRPSSDHPCINTLAPWLNCLLLLVLGLWPHSLPHCSELLCFIPVRAGLHYWEGVCISLCNWFYWTPRGMCPWRSQKLQHGGSAG